MDGVFWGSIVNVLYSNFTGEMYRRILRVPAWTLRIGWFRCRLHWHINWELQPTDGLSINEIELVINCWDEDEGRSFEP